MSCRMACTLGKDAQKSIRNQLFVGSLPHPTAQHFVTFGVPQPQIISHQLDVLTYGFSRALFNQNPYTNYGGTAVVISTCEPESWGTPECGATARKSNKRTRVPTARIDTWLTNSGPFLKLYAAMLCIFFCHCPSLPRSNISTSLSLSHAYHALMVCL